MIISFYNQSYFRLSKYKRALAQNRRGYYFAKITSEFSAITSDFHKEIWRMTFDMSYTIFLLTSFFSSRTKLIAVSQMLADEKLLSRFFSFLRRVFPNFFFFMKCFALFCSWQKFFLFLLSSSSISFWAGEKFITGD